MSTHQTYDISKAPYHVASSLVFYIDFIFCFEANCASEVGNMIARK